MADSIDREKSLAPELINIEEIKKQSTVIEHGPPTRYHLNSTTGSHDQSEPYRKITFGERDSNKPHKTILMVGETSIGKTTLINVMINYMLGVQREDKVWFEITDDQSDRTSVHSQTSIITVYGFYLQESPIHLTIIDTPGYGDTRGVEQDKEIAESLCSLIKPEEGINEIHTVCLVVKSTQTRLSDTQIYIFDAVQSLFGRDIAENIVLLFTHSRGSQPKNVLTAVKDAKIKCALNDENKPVYFLFDNCQSEAADEENEYGKEMLEQSWSLSLRGMTEFHNFIKNIKPKPLQMTQDVLCQRKQLEANISKIQAIVQVMEQKQNEQKETQAALEKKKKYVQENKNFEYEAEESVKEIVDLHSPVPKDLGCCTNCQQNCYPESGWLSSSKDQCTHCQCNTKKHIKGKYYITRKQKEKRTKENLKEEYDAKIREDKSLVKNLEHDLQELEKEKIKRVFDAFHFVETLQLIALNTVSLITLQHIDFLIEKMKEINEPEKMKTLENIKKRAEGKHKEKMEDVKMCITTENEKSAL